jgi:hypothetical protein
LAREEVSIQQPANVPAVAHGDAGVEGEPPGDLITQLPAAEGRRITSVPAAPTFTASRCRSCRASSVGRKVR